MSFFQYWKKLNHSSLIVWRRDDATQFPKMSAISPQISRVLDLESKSSDSSAVIVRLHVKTKTKLRKSTKTIHKVIPLREEADIPFIINILHESGGARAPYLPSDDAPDSP